MLQASAQAVDFKVGRHFAEGTSRGKNPPNVGVKNSNSGEKTVIHGWGRSSVG
jgi:hypothetical protein